MFPHYRGYHSSRLFRVFISILFVERSDPAYSLLTFAIRTEAFYIPCSFVLPKITYVEEELKLIDVDEFLIG